MKFLYNSILCFIASACLAGQSLPQEFDPENFKESVVVVTDRDFYAVNETIHFKAFNFSSSGLRDREWSKVLYLELVSFDGKPLVQSKIKYSRSGGEGQLLVPGDLRSGVYYIKAYTRWMRNYGPASYFYKPLTLLNPKNGNVSVPAKAFEADFKLTYSTLNDMKGIKVDQDVFSLRSTGQWLFSDSTSRPSDFSVSITKKGYLCDTLLSLSPLDTSLSFINRYLPETRGISLSGVVVDPSTREPIPNCHITLTLKKGKHQTYSAFSNSSGIFNVALPEVFGNAELLLLAENGHAEKPEIHLESDFCKRRISLPYIPLKTNEEDYARYTDLIINSQIDALYNPEEGKADTSSLDEIYFYEKPSLRLNVDQFIEMSSLAELFKELVPAVGFRKENGQTTMHIAGPYYYNLDTYEPLVLLDGIIIWDFDELLQINPNDLITVETFNFPYVLGDITYGGIIKMYSREGNMAGYKLPDNGLIYSFQGFDKVLTIELKSGNKRREPVFKNTLYWKAFSWGSFDQPNCFFSTGDNPGEYTAILHEVNEDGEMSISKWNFNLE